jgi:uncharacterized SAM-binding protein YcdF (DUF218 family)
MPDWTVLDSVAVVLFVRRLLATVLVALTLWLVAAFQVFFNVHYPPAERTDAVIMLGGASAERLPAAQQLRDSLDIPVLVVSHTDTPGNASADALCHQGTPDGGGSLLCLRLSEKDTRGEARAIGDLIATKGWTSITVVTSRYHLARAGLLIGQCTTADITLVGSTPDFNLRQWVDRFVVETGGLLDSALRPECAG